MQLPVTYSKSALSICLTVLLLTPLPALAALSSADEARLNQYEKTVFGAPRTKLSEESRLRALEINLFGKAKTGSTTSRLNAIAKLVGNSSQTKYLPPIAAEMDRSAFAPTNVQPAPDPTPDASNDSYNSSDSSQQSAADSQSDKVKDLLRQALIKHNNGDLSGAQRLFRQVIAIDPRNTDAYFNLGAMAEDAGDLNSARRYYQTAKTLSPNDKDIADAVTAINNKIQQQQTAQQTEQQLQLKVQDKQIADDAAAAYRAGKYDQAINDLDRVAQNAPNDPNVMYGLAQAWRGKGDLNRAQDYLNRAIAMNPSNQLYRTTLADVRRDIQRQQVANEPKPAPDYGNRGYGSGGGSGNGGSGYDNGNQGLQSYGNDQVASNDPSGGIQPFTSKGEPTLYGHAMGSNYMRGSGFGGIGGGLIGGALGGGPGLYYGRSYYGGTGTRLVRAGVGALAGAAIGGLMNMHGYGGFRSGAIRGAVSGGLFSLITGF